MKYVCDFETSTAEWLKIDDEARVWAGCCVEVSKSAEVKFITNNITDFMTNLFELGNITCYFHNLKYDGDYIINWLFDNGFVYDESGKKEKSFNVVISDMNEWYELCITHKVYNRKYKRTKILDSFKKIPLKVSDIAKAFDLEESKGVIDYDKYRPIGYELDDNELDYVTNDCVIVAKALYEFELTGLDKMTIGGDALSWFKKSIGGDKAFNYLFPKVNLETDNDFRLAYKGGFCLNNDKFRNKLISGFSVDVNSLYPAVMYGLMGSLPYGKPIQFTGEYEFDSEYPLYIQKFTCSFKLKPNHIPTIQLKNNYRFLSTEYIKDSKGIVDLTLTGVDIELLKEHYDVVFYDFIGGYKFKEASNIFKEYIDFWSKIKKESTGGKRTLAKRMLNSLYGKFATNPVRQNKHPVYVENEHFSLELNELEMIEPIYTPIACYITARARAFTIRNSQALYKHWVYSDTDSMYLTGITEEEASKYITIHPKNLGAWKVEHHFITGKFLRAKTYIIDSVEDNITIACAGMPDNIKESLIMLGKEKCFDCFRIGAKFMGKLTPQAVKGGVVLKNGPFSIKE